jgi:protein-L-isoaspartate O-methyltransferase
MLRFYPEVYDLRPWYHDFARLGIQTRFAVRRRDQLAQLLSPLRRVVDRGYVEKGERFSLRQFIHPSAPTHVTNQQQKESIIIPYLQRSVQALGIEQPLRCLDLFCADGYYSCILAQQYANTHVTGVDLDAAELNRARTAARLLGLSNGQFEQADAWDYLRAAPSFDLILCTGGLYHLSDPRGFLRLLRANNSAHLIVQSVVTQETDDADYFISPAPGWRHGSRFTHAALGSWLTDLGWRIQESALNELPGNARQCDRGSSYYRCALAVSA